jgi:succinate dehydrogenase/fumarate reductase-like Fe-S protein
MNLTLRIWRQQNANAQGQFVTYQVREVIPDMSFLEMLDALNEDLLSQGESPVAFEHDCREGICGSCGFLINGVAHGGGGEALPCANSRCAFSRMATRSRYNRTVARPRLPGDPRSYRESVSF